DLERMESDDLEISLRELLPVRGCRTVTLRRPGLEAGFAVVEGHRRRRRTGVDAATEELELRGATAAQADAGEEVATRNELRVHAERRDRQPGELTIRVSSSAVESKLISSFGDRSGRRPSDVQTRTPPVNGIGADMTRPSSSWSSRWSRYEAKTACPLGDGSVHQAPIRTRDVAANGSMWYVSVGEDSRPGRLSYNVTTARSPS